MKCKIFLFTMMAASLLNAFSYSGPQSWESWFSDSDTLMNQYGLPAVSDVTVTSGSMVITIGEFSSRAVLPELRDFSHVMPLYYSLYLGMLEPRPNPLHRQVTLAFLINDPVETDARREPEYLVLKDLYGEFLRNDPEFLGRVWSADRQNGTGKTLQAINAVLYSSGFDSVGSLFKDHAIDTMDSWLPFMENRVHTTLLPQPSPYIFASPDPLTIGQVTLDMNRLTSEGVMVDRVLEPNGIRACVLATYSFPVQDYDLRPLKENCRIPVKGLRSLQLLLFNMTEEQVHEPVTMTLSPIQSYPATLTETTLSLQGDQILLSFDVETAQDVQAWVILKSELVDNEQIINLASILPAVPFSLEPMTFQLVDTTGDLSTTSYTVYALTQGGFLAHLDEVDSR